VSPLRRGILGGTFDPPHLGHLVAATNARQDLQLDEVWFVPAGDPYRKAGRMISSRADRLRLVQAAIADLPWARVSTIELDRDGPTYTTDTLRELVRDGGQWWFILGSDALGDLPHWREPATIVDQVRLALARRPGVGESEIPRETLSAVPGIESRIDYIEMPLLEISSTDLRERIRDGRTTEFLVTAAVRSAINELGLYEGG
jgi:nicotinate-nucleotide adenylyltransferase